MQAHRVGADLAHIRAQELRHATVAEQECALPVRAENIADGIALQPRTQHRAHVIPVCQRPEAGATNRKRGGLLRRVLCKVVKPGCPQKVGRRQTASAVRPDGRKQTLQIIRQQESPHPLGIRVAAPKQGKPRTQTPGQILPGVLCLPRSQEGRHCRDALPRLRAQIVQAGIQRPDIFIRCIGSLPARFHQTSALSKVVRRLTNRAVSKNGTSIGTPWNQPNRSHR